MNLLIENLNTDILNNLDANIIKTLKGQFTKENIQEQIGNLYYNKVIIDITAIDNYSNYKTLFSFLESFDKEKIILFLSDNVSKEYVSKLVQEGYYNFTKNIGGVNYLINNSNKLEDVEKYLVVNTFQSVLTNTSLSSNASNNEIDKNKDQIIIGIQNLTPHAGATTLMYMLIKELKAKYSVVGIEMFNQDSIYFRDNDIIESTSLEDLKMRIRLLSSKKIIVIDLNDLDTYDFCDEILCLVEPGTISLSRLLSSNKDYSSLLEKGKIILNRSSVKDEDIENFKYNTKLDVFYNLSNINERSNKLKDIENLIDKLGL